MDTEELKAMIDNEPNDVLDVLSTEEVAGYYDSSQCDVVEVKEDKKTSQAIWKSPVLYVSILAIIGLVLNERYGLVTDTMWSAITDLVLVLLAGFGIINSPNTKDGLG